MVTVIKRNGTRVPFEKEKITAAINKAFIEVDGTLYENDTAADIAADIEKRLAANTEISIEQIQDLVEEYLMRSDRLDVAKAYIKYRYDREKARVLRQDLEKRYDKIRELIAGTDEESNKENSNKDTRVVPTMRDYIAGFTCRELADKVLLPKDVATAHKEGIIHFHDSDYSPAMPMTNCGLINLKDMLENGTVISGTKIHKPHSLRTASTLATQIITQVASCQYGGCSISLAHLAPFVDISRSYLKKNNPDLTIEQVERLVRQEIKDSIQTIQYQLITMSTTNGQAPFVTLFMWINEVPVGQTRDDLVLLIEEVLRQRIAGIPNEQGYPITIAFPKLIYCLDDNNSSEDSEYWWLTTLAAECSAKRLVPDYISAKIMREIKGDVFTCMGCRSFLSPDPVGHQYYGKFNQGVVTLNLVDVALSSHKNIDTFWQILNERLQLCKKALMVRHNALLGVKSDVAPILWQHGAYARLKPGETIDKLLYNNRSTISLGYAGLYECIKYMTDSNQLEQQGKEFGLAVMRKLNEACDLWKAETNISFSVYGSPIESTTFKFAKCLRKRFGIIEGITDKDYVTNSYHITPSQEIDAFNKLRIESEFQCLSPGGLGQIH